MDEPIIPFRTVVGKLFEGLFDRCYRPGMTVDELKASMRAELEVLRDGDVKRALLQAVDTMVISTDSVQ